MKKILFSSALMFVLAGCASTSAGMPASYGAQPVLADDLRSVASSQDRYVEAAESAAHRWTVGVQWHPERPEMRPDAGALFRAFVEACA